MQEAIRLVYKDNDSLLVSIHSLHRISKYKGKDGGEPKIKQTGYWCVAKNEKPHQIEGKGYCQRTDCPVCQTASRKRLCFSRDSYLQNELEASFIYEDTPDQKSRQQP